MFSLKLTTLIIFIVRLIKELIAEICFLNVLKKYTIIQFANCSTVLSFITASFSNFLLLQFWSFFIHMFD